MTVSEIKAVWEMQRKSDKPIYLGYTRPSGKTGVAYIDFSIRDSEHFKLYTLKYGMDINFRNLKTHWRHEALLHLEDQGETLYIHLKKAQGGEVIAPIDGVFFQNEKKGAKVMVLYGR